MRAQSVAAAYFAVRSASPVVADLRATAQLAAALGCVWSGRVEWMCGVDVWSGCVEWMCGMIRQVQVGVRTRSGLIENVVVPLKSLWLYMVVVANLAPAVFAQS